ncbi:MAG: hypothetical protein IPJ88_14095 [Myxococcales bacterium]|nr:MAG: hypothetical protein IPJ88_14095 [Myxococcales bacterium]
MPDPFLRFSLLAAGLLFVTFLLVKLRAPARLDRHQRKDLKQRLAAAKREAREAENAEQKASAWRKAATIALDELGQPSLAGSYARRAERADPSDEAAIGILVRALRSASRLAALERFLWRRLAAGPQTQGAAYVRAFNELISLYEGPLRRKARAKALKALAPQLMGAERR